MDEAKRFLRYALPGTVTVMVLILALLISDWSAVTRKLSGLSELLGFGAGVAAVLGVYGLGYLLSTIYWPLYHWGWVREGLSVNHRTLWETLHHNKLMRIQGADRSYLTLDTENGSFTRRRAWFLAAIYAESRVRNDKRGEHVLAFADRLVDVMHAAGTSLIGTLVASVVWLGVHYWSFSLGLWYLVPGAGFLAALLFLVVLIGCICRCYWITNKTLSTITNSAIAERIMRDGSENGFPVIITLVE